MRKQENNKARKRKSLLLALLLQGGLIGLCVYPFLISESTEPEAYETVVEFDFSKQSAAAASSRTRVRNKVEAPKTQRKAAPKNEAPPALPTKPAPPILTAPSSMPPLPDLPEVKIPDPEPVPEPAPTPVVVDAPVAKPGPITSTEDGDGDSNSTGDYTGGPETGDGDTVADEGNGAAALGAALEGDGVLLRAVLYRPRLDDVVIENGKVAVNVCVDRNGYVVAAKRNDEKSTIKTEEVLESALAKAWDYKFEQNRRAPKHECGVLTVIVSGL